jgi:hypothetical protein
MFENIASVRIAARQKSSAAALPGAARLQTTTLPNTNNPEMPDAPPAKEPAGAGSSRLARNNIQAAQKSDRRESIAVTVFLRAVTGTVAP